MARRFSTPLLWLILLAAAFVVFAWGFGVVVRMVVARKADALGVAVDVGAVRPAWGGVNLRDVRVSVAEVPSVAARFDSVVVGVSGVRATGGKVVVKGQSSAVREEVRAWRAGRSKHGAAQTGRGGRQISVQDVVVEWSEVLGPGSRVVATGLSVGDVRRLSSIAVQRAVFSVPGLAVAAFRAQVGVSASQRLAVLTAGKVVADIDTAVFSPFAWGTNARAADGASGELTASKTKEKNEAFGERLRRVRDEARRAMQRALAFVEPDAPVVVEALELRLRRGEHSVLLGPGRMVVNHTEDAVGIDLTPSTSNGESGITFAARFPLTEGPISLRVVGGPLPLAALGVKDGNFGLVGVDAASVSADGSVEIDAQGDSIAFQGKYTAANFGLADRRLATAPVRGLNLTARLQGSMSLDQNRLTLKDAQVGLGNVVFALTGYVDRTGGKLRTELEFGVAPVSCQDFLDALPQSLAPTVHGMSAEGTFSLSGHLRYDDDRAQEYAFDYRLANDCRFTKVPEHIDVRRFSRPFQLQAYDSKGKPVMIQTGPGTGAWVEHGGISEFMEAAVLTCEDRSFRYHRGFDREAIRNSIRENLRQRKFFRGASTVTMQLAKNLYLSREKTVARKFQELILTSYLEQALTKTQILELYLNVIEFGPMVYGIRSASAHYFRKSPTDLSLTQAMYLASILPSPRREHFGANGAIHESWMRYLYKLVQTAGRNNWVTEDQMQAALGETLVRGQAQPSRVTVPASSGLEPGDDPVASDDEQP